jgi:hypothetical protein
MEKRTIDLSTYDAGTPKEKHNVYDITTFPRQDIPESEKTPDWYIKNVRYISSFYNRPYVPVVTAYTTYFNTSGDRGRGNGDSNNTGRNQIYPVNEMLENIQYYQGRQPNDRYNWMVQNVTTTNLQAGWVKGRKITQLVDYAKGAVRAMVTNASFSVRTMSPNAVSARSEFLDKILLKIEMEEAFNALSADTGVAYAPANGMNFENPQEAQEFVEPGDGTMGGFKDANAELATDMANGIWTENNWTEKAMSAFNYVETCGVCGIEHYAEGGRLYQDVIPPYQLIMDLRNDDDYNRKARFVGGLQCQHVQYIQRYAGI